MRREAYCSFSNIEAAPCGAKPAWVITPKPTRSASRSMSREKLSWFCIAMAWLPMITACPASPLPLLVAAIMPSTSAASISGMSRLCLAMRRAMWRCVTCDSSCPSTVASSSRLSVTAISPRCTPR